MRFLFSLLLISGCGFLGEAPFAGRRVSEVSPWQDVGPLPICDGEVFLVGPMASPAGLCAMGLGAACSGDSGCKSRERCLCGRCTTSTCEADPDCPAGYVCNSRRCERPCQSSNDCKSGEVCDEGRQLCRGPCDGDDECQEGEVCNLGTNECQITPCSDDATCSGGRRCVLQRQPANLAEPTPIATDRGVTMWLERDQQILRADSPDGIHFRLDPAATPLQGRSPSVALGGSGFLMVFASGSDLVRATSADGLTWTADATPILAGGDMPSLVSHGDGSYAVYFVTGGAVARAFSPDGMVFDPPATVLEPAALADDTLWRNVDRIAAPFAQSFLDAGGRQFVRVWFAARGQESAPAYNFGQFQEVPANFSLGAATSDDGINFLPYPFNPVFDRVVAFIEHPSELDPAIVTVGDEQLLYYRRASPDGAISGELGFARSPQRAR
jgi:hypothetical protein